MKKKLKLLIIFILILAVGVLMKPAYRIIPFNYFINNIELYIKSENSDKYRENVSRYKNDITNINKANFAQLMNIKYMGRNNAIRIIMYRESNGEIHSFGDLLQIIDIKEKHIEIIKRQICF